MFCRPKQEIGKIKTQRRNVSLQTRRETGLSTLFLRQEVTDRNTLLDKESAGLSAFSTNIRQNFDILIPHLGNPKTCESTHSHR
jgi:hypothetical protein